MNKEQITIELPKQVLQVFELLSEHGYSAYIYGECVRLLIKGQTPLDYDIMTDAEPNGIEAIFETRPPHNFIRISSYSHTDAKGFLSENTAFTFDAVAYKEKTFLDPFDGVEALKNSRLVLLPNKFPGHVDHKSIDAVLMWKDVSAVLCEHVSLITEIIPELNMLDSETLSLTFKAVGSSSPILSLRYALLLHELGKPDCHSTIGGEDFYHGYAERSRIYAVRIMTRLGCPPEDIRETEHIIEHCGEILQNPRRVHKSALIPTDL